MTMAGFSVCTASYHTLVIFVSEGLLYTNLQVIRNIRFRGKKTKCYAHSVNKIESVIERIDYGCTNELNQPLMTLTLNIQIPEHCRKQVNG